MLRTARSSLTRESTEIASKLTMPSSLRRPAGWLASCALAAMVLATASSTRAPAGTSILPPGAIAPTDNQRRVARKVGDILEQAHYRRAAIDDRLSVQVFERYLDFLDGQRSYFL